ncbi:enzymatic polyprotein [Trichonephila inaurata madagascariensis]|uniref:Enzymatic polyprotein n=1 Tax=Trichonephila inaurata madagascariensis TaxID=2747483 RepID=A0A8X6IVZ4_9ARAC|nr:enzymatic polyprotein [Trichonephila inaurata madagascariensis]
MEENSKHFTAFVTRSGHYQWKILPFEMKNAGSTFQNSLNQVLSPQHNFCRSYIDDIAVFSETWSDHMQHLEDVFKTLREVGLTVNLEKCDFEKSQVKFLSHVVGSGKHAPDPQKVLHSTVLPLTNLTKKNIPNNIPWDDKAEESFQCLKKSLIQMPTLYTPVLNCSFQLYTDASATVVGACLEQNDENGMEHPIAHILQYKINQMSNELVYDRARGLCRAECIEKV